MKTFSQDPRRVGLLVSLVALPILGVSCAKRVDTTDPEALATAFVTAVANEDIAEALQYVIPEERTDFQKEWEQGLPPFPKNPKIKVNVKGDSAHIAILNAKFFGMDMKQQDGRWWIVK